MRSSTRHPFDSKGRPAALPHIIRIFSAPGSPTLGNWCSARFRAGVGLAQNAIQIAIELRAHNARDFQPAEDAGLGTHPALSGQFQQSMASACPLWQVGGQVPLQLAQQPFRTPAQYAPRIGQQVAGVFPNHEFEWPFGGRQRRLAIMRINRAISLI